jgi:hypothetical protein
VITFKSTDEVKQIMGYQEAINPKYLLSQNVGTIAEVLVPWLEKNPKFTLLAALNYLSLPKDASDDKILVGPVIKALYRLRCEVVGYLPTYQGDQGAKVYQYIEHYVSIKADVPVRVTTIGFSTNPDDQAPEEDQILVCQAWLKEHARPTKTYNKKISTYGLKHQVEGWTQFTGQFKDQIQVEKDTQEKYTSPRFYVTEGAFMIAAQREGYHLAQDQDSRNGYLNISVKRPGQPWRGRKPKAWTDDTQELPKTRKLAFISDKEYYDPERIRRILIKYLNTRKHVWLTENVPPFFTLSQAAGIVRLHYEKGKAPGVLIKVLEELECVTSRPMIKGKKKVKWCRYSDMSKEWQEIYNHTQYLKQQRKKEAEAKALRIKEAKAAGIVVTKRTRNDYRTRHKRVAAQELLDRQKAELENGVKS